MDEFDLCCVKEIPVQRRPFLRANAELSGSTVHAVTNHGVMKVGEVDPNLVGSACLRFCINEGEMVKPSHYTIQRYGIPRSDAFHFHPRAPDRVTPGRHANCSQDSKDKTL